jgi:predicted RNA binding protein YcfA (HicA-like mRNA interferase family)
MPRSGRPQGADLKEHAQSVRHAPVLDDLSVHHADNVENVDPNRAAGGRIGPANVRFADLRRLVVAIGYTLRRQKGSHQVFTHAARPYLPMVNLQSDGATAKPYQVRQVLRLIEENSLEVKS